MLSAAPLLIDVALLPVTGVRDVMLLVLPSSSDDDDEEPPLRPPHPPPRTMKTASHGTISQVTSSAR